MNYREPTEEEIELMKSYSNVCSQALEIIMKCEENIMLSHASARLQESMSWFHTYVINGGKSSSSKAN